MSVATTSSWLRPTQPNWTYDQNLCSKQEPMLVPKIRYHFRYECNFTSSQLLRFPSLRPSLPPSFPPSLPHSLPPSFPPSLQNGVTPLDVATNSNKGDAEGVSQALQKYMKESATAHSHHVSVWLHVLWCHKLHH